mgnify:CR=1 FL=1
MRAVLLILGVLLSFYSLGQNENNLIRYYSDGNYKLYVDYYEKYFDNEYSIPSSTIPKDSFEKLGNSAKSLIKDPSDRTQNIYTTIIVIIVFCLMFNVLSSGY